MQTGRHLVLVLLTLLSVSLPPASAQELIDRRSRHERRADPGGISLDQAVDMAQRRYGAKSIKAETVGNGERRVHQIRLLSKEGKVWTVRIDAQSGAMR